MKNFDEKTKDMKKAILPCKRPKTYRAFKRIVHKAERTANRTHLHEAVRDMEDFEEHFEERQKGGYGMNNIRAVVNQRREMDKIGPLMNWAKATLKGMARDAGEALLNKIFGHSTIGRHAAEHASGVLPYDRPGRNYRHKKAPVVLNEENLRTVLAGFHKQFNLEFIRTCRDIEARSYWTYRIDPKTKMPVRRFPPAKPLLGFHDIKDFITRASKDSIKIEAATVAIKRVLGKRVVYT